MNNTSIEELLSTDGATEPVVSRRDFVKGGVSGAAAISLTAMASKASAQVAYTDDYGPIAPVNDDTTGLPLIALPEGFSYKTFGWRGQPMVDGNLTPGGHDGMGVVASKGSRIALVRNHELTNSSIRMNCPAEYNPAVAGGTSNLIFDALSGQWIASYASLTGTIRNCAGGKTPWGSWLTCEETTATNNGYNHGWVFDIPGFGAATAQPIKAMGRFSHEACAVDPVSDYIYETEDARPSAFYQFRPNQPNNPSAGGSLYALKVVGIDDFVFGDGSSYPSFANGTSWDVEWVLADDPEALDGRVFNSAPGRASFSRGEGCWYDSGKIFFVSTDGGAARQGQVYVYDPRRETLTMIFESTGSSDIGNTTADNPDNIAVSPRGGILMCEDGGSPCRLRGLTPTGGSFIFAENVINLSAGDIAHADFELNASGNIIDNVNPGNYVGQEWAGADFHNEWLFVNIQTPGITFAITGPWNKGAL
ncbi:PhoX family phosphatase [Oceanicoccus sp. KOV_DT_Chl]|uniref:PhoX family protein n=1 Tax=Oceanicoccus sp. KOV_DT_Chl TaxID=1904639 RepID=UPI000C7E4C10|nr:alkaline phosphatase PhoX [Oceanicoccus sp. KOV_DT_Chl]